MFDKWAAYFFLALPVNEYLNAVIIIEVSIKLPFARRLAYFVCLSRTTIKKKTPDDAGPAGSLALLPVAGRQKLAEAQAALASCSTTCCAAQRQQMGDSTPAQTCPGSRYLDEPLLYLTPKDENTILCDCLNEWKFIFL